MVSRILLDIYRPALTYLGYWSECVELGVAMLAGIAEHGASKLMADPKSATPAEFAQNHEGFIASLEDGSPILFYPSVGDRETLLPYIGILCGGDSL
jgi:hypothetical protein